MKHETVVWLSVAESLVWERNPLRLMVTHWVERAEHLWHVRTNMRLTQAHLHHQQQRLAQLEALTNEPGGPPSTGHHLNLLR